MRVLKTCGRISTSCPTLKTPSSSVPVTTVPKPVMVKTRSMGRRGRAIFCRSSASFRIRSSSRTSSGRPWPVYAETGRMAAFARVVGFRYSRTSSRTSSSHSSSTRSAFVSSNNQQRGIDATHARQHILDEALVSGHINDADLAPVRQLQPRKAQVNGHAAFFFFRQSIRINSCQGLYQRRFAVIDMPCGAYTTHMFMYLDKRKMNGFYYTP